MKLSDLKIKQILHNQELIELLEGLVFIRRTDTMDNESDELIINGIYIPYEWLNARSYRPYDTEAFTFDKATVGELVKQASLIEVVFNSGTDNKETHRFEVVINRDYFKGVRSFRYEGIVTESDEEDE